MIKPITASNAGGDFEIPEPGVYVARCFRMIDLGTQTINSERYGTSNKRQVILFWELLEDDNGEKVADSKGEVFTVMKTYTLSLNKNSNLLADINAWRGKALDKEQASNFDITVLVDKYCLLQIVHKTSDSNGRTYANLGTIMATKKKPEGINEANGFSMDDPDMEMFAQLPEWIQTKLRDAKEWKETPESLSAGDAKTNKKESPEDRQLTEDELSEVPF